MTERIDLNRDWEFTGEYTEPFARFEGSYERVELPHTCKETPYDYFDESIYQMLCAYRRILCVPAGWAGKRVFLHIDGAAHYSEVFLNGKKLGEHRCGYTAYEVELTESLSPGGEARLLIRLDSRESLDFPPFGKVIDYMTYGGLYREVWLEVREPCFVEDVFVRPVLPGTVHSAVTLSGPACSRYTVRQRLYLRGEEQGEPLAQDEFSPEEGKAQCTLSVRNPQRWSVDSPVLYTLVTELMDGGAALDRNNTVFGFRRAEFRADGFYLNGAKIKLMGLNRHQSYPYVGYAMPESMQRLDADILKKELGLNAVRTSHYPQSRHFIDRCDELGLLVFTEIPGWQHIGDSEWKEQALRNVEDMVRQYRNHPSIILWGVRINESQDEDELYARTNAAAHRLDPTRPTGGVRYLKKSSFLEDVYTYNDFSHDGEAPGCEPKKHITPDAGRPYLISEYNGHMFPTKSYDSEDHRLEHALRHAAVLDAVAGQEDIAGSFGWCMFDYNTHQDFGSGDRVCYHGVMDMFRNKKLAAEVYASQGGEEPVLEVSSAMDIGEHPAACLGRVFAFTNADSVKVYKGEVFIREFTHAGSPYKHLKNAPIEIDDFVGEQVAENENLSPGQARTVKELLNHVAKKGLRQMPPSLLLKMAWLTSAGRMRFADAYALYDKYINNWGGTAVTWRFEAVKDGKTVKTVVRSPFKELRLRAEADHRDLAEGATYDVALVRLAMTDQNGMVLPFYQGAVELEVSGPLRLIGPKSAMLRGGMGGTYVRTLGETGPAALTLRPENAPPVEIAFTVSRR